MLVNVDVHNEFFSLPKGDVIREEGRFGDEVLLR